VCVRSSTRSAYRRQGRWFKPLSVLVAAVAIVTLHEVLQYTLWWRISVTTDLWRDGLHKNWLETLALAVLWIWCRGCVHVTDVWIKCIAVGVSFVWHLRTRNLATLILCQFLFDFVVASIHSGSVHVNNHNSMRECCRTCCCQHQNSMSDITPVADLNICNE